MTATSTTIKACPVDYRYHPPVALPGIALMLTRIKQYEAAWFTQWRLYGEAFLPRHYARQIVVLHPGTVPVLDKYPSFQAPNPNDERASDIQQQIMDRTLLETFSPETPTCFGMYAGYFTKNDWGVSRGFDEPDGTWVFAGNLPFILFGAPLKDATFAAIERRWENVFLTELSFIWPEDRSWFLASAPDLAFTLIGTDEDALAERLLGEPELNALEWMQDACGGK